MVRLFSLHFRDFQFIRIRLSANIVVRALPGRVWQEIIY
jgi:hypothetical protein